MIYTVLIAYIIAAIIEIILFPYKVVKSLFQYIKESFKKDGEDEYVGHNRKNNELS